MVECLVNAWHLWHSFLQFVVCHHFIFNSLELFVALYIGYSLNADNPLFNEVKGFCKGAFFIFIDDFHDAKIMLLGKAQVIHDRLLPFS